MPRLGLPLFFALARRRHERRGSRVGEPRARADSPAPRERAAEPGPGVEQRELAQRRPPAHRSTELRGRVVLLNFWVFTCYNCTNTVPSLVDFDRKYRDQGLTIIGIHTPEFPPYAGEHDQGNVERALRQYGIEYPNAQDNDYRTWNLYGIRLLAELRADRQEGVTSATRAYGEFHLNDGSYRTWDERIQELLAE